MKIFSRSCKRIIIGLKNDIKINYDNHRIGQRERNKLCAITYKTHLDSKNSEKRLENFTYIYNDRE